MSFFKSSEKPIPGVSSALASLESEYLSVADTRTKAIWGAVFPISGEAAENTLALIFSSGLSD